MAAAMAANQAHELGGDPKSSNMGGSLSPSIWWNSLCTTWCLIHAFFTTNATAIHLLNFARPLWLCFLTWLAFLLWWHVCVGYFTLTLKHQNRKRAHARLAQRMKTDHALGAALETAEADAKTETVGVDPRKKTPLKFGVCVHVPSTSKSRKKMEQLVVDTIGADMQMRGSSVLQTEMEICAETVSKLEDLADRGTKINKKFAVQLGRWRVIAHGPDGVKILTLDDGQVPIILHSSCEAGKLIVEGLNLSGAEIKTTSHNKIITFKNCTTEKEINGLQIWTSDKQLSLNNLHGVGVYAKKPILVEENEVNVCSSIIKIEDGNLKIVLRIGLPSTILFIYVMVTLLCFSTKLEQIPLIAIILPHILPQSMENVIKTWFEQIRLALVAFCIATCNLFIHEDCKPTNRKMFVDGDLHDKISMDKRGPIKREKSNLDNDTKIQDQMMDEEIELAMEACKIQDQMMDEEEIELSMEACKIERKKVYRDDDEDYRIMHLHNDDDEYTGGSQNKYEYKRGSSGGSRYLELPDIPKIEYSKQNRGNGSRGKEKKTSVSFQEPDCFAYEEYIDKYQRIAVRKRDPIKSTIIEEKSPFHFIYGMEEKLWFKRDYFMVYSFHLIQILLKLFPKKFDLKGSKKIKVLASDFFYIQNELREMCSFEEKNLDNLSRNDKDGKDNVNSHLKYLWHFLDITFEEVLEKYVIMKNKGRVSWDMIWAFFPSGTKVAYKCEVTDEELYGTIESIEHICRPTGPEWMITLQTWDYNSRTWKAYSTIRSIPSFADDCNFTALDVHPLEFKSDPHEVERMALSRGERFCELSMLVRNRFMNYKGLIYIFQRGSGGSLRLSKQNASGRVMIDLTSFAKMNADFPMVSAKPPNKVLRDNKIKLINISTAPNRMYAPTFVYGFSFQLKRWGTFNISGFGEIDFNELAYDALVMDSGKKDIIYSLVQEYKHGDGANHNNMQIDPIAAKGEGCIFLCYGPPGTGKTLTAESIAETLHSPLWSLSVSELGLTPSHLEEKLVQIMEVAASWGAIVLLDEADIYLEKRSGLDLHRNAMTGIFLRNLEYYRGVLFLTTNRVVAFDEAFCSRVSMFIYYKDHSQEDRWRIWKTMLKRLNLHSFPDHLLTVFASYKLNGREIRNIIQTARTLSKKNGVEINENYLKQSLLTLVASLQELKEVTK